MNIRNISNKELHKYTSLSKNDNCNFKNELLKWLGDGRTKIVRENIVKSIFIYIRIYNHKQWQNIKILKKRI